MDEGQRPTALEDSGRGERVRCIARDSLALFGELRSDPERCAVPEARQLRGPAQDTRAAADAA